VGGREGLPATYDPISRAAAQAGYGELRAAAAARTDRVRRRRSGVNAAVPMYRVAGCWWLSAARTMRRHRSHVEA
ncbi:MAG: hypothetical protein LC769_03880, partial [Chloroflexi bacterium]|nr:hypothetical protein [Chloroflexota bacterium]